MAEKGSAYKVDDVPVGESGRCEDLTKATKLALVNAEDGKQFYVWKLVATARPGPVLLEVEEDEGRGIE